jgi:NADPH:quinone reductase-like Zn-dependent oxidoreductase
LAVCARLEIPASRRNRLGDLQDDEHLRATGFFETIDDAAMGTLTFPGVPVRLDGQRFRTHRRTWAEQADVPAQRVLPLPPSIGLREAAVLPIAALTAWLMCRMAGVQSGKDVLVTGASGGVGHFAVQIAKSLGARVTATGSAGKRGFIEALGSDAFPDYQQAPSERSGRSVTRCRTQAAVMWTPTRAR